MDVPSNMREIEEQEEVNLQTKRKSKSLHHQNISNISYTSSDTSVITTELSNSSSFEYSSSMEDYYINNNNKSNSINGNNNTITNGENPKINGVRIRSVKKNDEEEAVEALSEADEKASFDETNKRDNYSNVAHNNQDSNGTTARQKGVDVIEYSFSENNGGDKETDIRSNTDGGSKNLGILLDESSSRVNVTVSEIYDDTENTLRKIVVLNDKDEVIKTSHSKDNEQEFEEYDVEKVVEKQKTHDIICPNCKHCITDRVILKRRKRKAPEPESEVPSSENRPSPIDLTAEPVTGISCFSCFSIFIPKGDRFLWWRFKPATNVPLNAGDTPPEDKGPAELTPEDGTGPRFPMWILTCCQPTYTGRPLPKPEQERPPTPKDGREGVGHETGVSSPPSEEGQAPADTQPTLVPRAGAENQLPTPKPAEKPESGPHFPLWILNCCQPSTETPGSEVPPHEIKRPSTPPDGSQAPPHAGKPYLPPSEGSEVPPHEIKHPSTPPDGSQVPSRVEKPSLPPSEGLEVPPHEIKHPSTLPDGSRVPPDVENSSFPPSKGSKDPIYEIKTPPPSSGLEVPPHDLQHPSPPPSDGHHIVPIATDPVTPPVTRPRLGGSGPDIIKAIVYGGLVECVTSLSVITSAAGGDATTLNIVALGLANVAGGLVLLLHNLRVLIHEHTTDRCQDQLGRRDHFLLHSVVAVISYLVFGLLSPIIYGFSFRLSDNKDYKLATLAAASLVCITILSIGKAYVRRQGYMQTIFYYLSVGFMVSGVGYVTGDLINLLLKKLGVFDPSAPVAMPRLEAGFVDGAWSSY